MVEQTAIIRNEYGIHARPSAVIFKETNGYPGHLQVSCLKGQTDLTSMLGLLCLGLERDDEVTIGVEGPDEQAMCDKLKDLFERNFDFPRD